MNNKYLVISYLAIRKLIGILGLMYPFILVFGAYALGGYTIQTHISAYYYTSMGDVFVGIMVAIGVFLIAYRGHEQKDNIAGNIGGFFALTTALFPTAPVNPTDLQSMIGLTHLGSAALLFLVLTYFSLCLFTRTTPNKTPTPEKRMRNKVYKVSGYLMLGSLLLMALYAFFLAGKYPFVDNTNPIFWLEALAMVVFGVSWLTKGEAILKDASP